MMRPGFRRSRVSGAAVLAAALLAGCSADGDRMADPADKPPGQGGTTAGYTDPVELLVAYTDAWEQKDYAALAVLLAPDFAFYPYGTATRDDFPPIPQPPWSRATELDVAANMFDPEYDGQVGPAESIRFSYTRIGMNEPVPGTFELPVNVVITLMTGPTGGYTSDTRLEWTMEPQPDGVLRVRKLAELAKPAPNGAEFQSWTSVKSFYR